MDKRKCQKCKNIDRVFRVGVYWARVQTNMRHAVLAGVWVAHGVSRYIDNNGWIMDDKELFYVSGSRDAGLRCRATV
jgi:hypothetical protein